MEDVRLELARLRRRMRVQTIAGIGVVVAAVFVMGGADVVAKSGVGLFVESDAYKVRTQDASSTLQDRLVVTGGVATSRLKVANGNLVLASQSSTSVTDAGTLWYDSSTGVLKYRDSTGWISTKTSSFASTARVLGRKSAGAGDAEECTLSDILDFVGSAAQGDILYRDASGWARLGAGTSGQVLKTQGSGANPLWATQSVPTVSTTARVLGRKSAGGGDSEECTLSDILDFVGSAAQGDILYRGASGWVRLAAGTSGQVLKTQGSSANPVWATLPAQALPTGYLDGLQMDAISATQVQLAAGRCRDKDDTFDIVLSSSDTATITTSSDIDFTEAANTWYYAWVIADSSGTNATRAFLSSSSTSPTLPSGYDKCRRVGAARNDGSSNFRQGVTNGRASPRLFWFSAGVLVLNAAGVQTTTQTLSLATMMPTTSGRALIAAVGSSTSWNALRVRRPGDSAWTEYGTLQAVTSAGSNLTSWSSNDIVTNASQQIEWKNDNGNAMSNSIEVKGYYDEP